MTRGTDFEAIPNFIATKANFRGCGVVSLVCQNEPLDIVDHGDANLS